MRNNESIAHGRIYANIGECETREYQQVSYSSFFVSGTTTGARSGGGQEEARKRHEARGSRLESYSVTFLSYSCFLLAA